MRITPVPEAEGWTEGAASIAGGEERRPECWSRRPRGAGGLGLSTCSRGRSVEEEFFSCVTVQHPQAFPDCTRVVPVRGSEAPALLAECGLVTVVPLAL